MNNLIESIKKCSPFDFVFIFLGFLGLLAPGFLVLYLYKPTLIEDLGTVKLFVFSFCLTSPVFILNAITVILLHLAGESDQAQTTDKGKNDELQLVFLECTSVTFAAFYVLLVIAYLFKLNFKTFLITMIVLELGFLIFGISYCAICGMKRKKKLQ
ncbi:MAG: hypothetical protein QQN41_08725 [Nitrosopumilus sp.]